MDGDMDALSAAIEAAAAAAAATSQSPPKSPEVKLEFKNEAPSPGPLPSSPLKRARSPIDDLGPPDEKRQKIEGEKSPADEKQQKSDGEEPLPIPDPHAQTEIEASLAADVAGDLTTEGQLDVPHDVILGAETEPTPVDDMPDMASSMADLDEITKMIQAAQEAAMGTNSVQEDHSMPDFSEVSGTNGDQSHDIDINSIMASITNSLENGGDGHDHGNLDHDMLNGVLPSSDLSLPVQAPPKKTNIWSDRAQYTRQTYILPTLGKVAIDILIALSDQPLEETITQLNDPDDSIGKEYGLLRSFFDSLRKQLSEDFPLLYPDQLDISSPEDREIIRIANLATSCASMFGANELGWPDLNASFLSTFVASGQQMASEEATLYLGLKTQMFLTLLESEQSKPRAQILEDLFVLGQEDALKKHHPDSPLAHSETKFLADAQARKSMLLNESQDANSIQALSQQYTYEAFLDDLRAYLDEHMANIEKLGSSPTSITAEADNTNLFDGVNGLESFDIDAAIAEAARAAQEAVGSSDVASHVPDDLAALISFASEQAQGQPGSTEMPSTVLSTSESAMRATNLALQTMQRNQYHPTTVQPTNTPSTNGQHPSQQPQQPPQPSQQPPQQQQYYAYPQQPNGGAQQSQNSNSLELPPGQHASSEVLYERARQAAAARSSTHARREGSHSTRRPWSPEEEKALMMGLDMVKGPHWSQILSLFGQQGRMSNILADRTQVQLKDKARNLKLFFLKTNSEMPYYLQCVTGELKTRAPTQAARKEAEERARLTSDPDDQARVSATLALGNLHNGNGQRPQPKPAPPKSVTPGHVTPHGQSHPGSPHASQLQRTSSAHASIPISAQPNAQHLHLAQAAQKPQVPVQPQQHAQQVQAVAPRPAQHHQSHVPLKPHQQQPLHPQALQQQTMQNHHRQPPQQQQLHQLQQQPQQQQQQQQQQHQHHAHPQQVQQVQQKPIQPQPQVQPQPHPHHHQHQHQPQPQPQPQPQQHPQQQLQQQQHQVLSQPSQASVQHQQPQPAASASVAPPPKAEESGIKHEPLNDEEAGLLELKRFMSQENNAESQEQSIEAALAAASAAAAAVAAQPAG